MSLPRSFYSPLVTTGAVARFRRPRPGWRSGWYPVVEAPRILGTETRTLDGYCWLERDGVPVHMRRCELEIEGVVVSD